jgi:hypothetical protein
MKLVVTVISLSLIQSALAAGPAFGPADEAAAFKAAGFKHHG